MNIIYKICIGAMAMMWTATANAQLLDFNIKSSNQIFVEQALSNAFPTLEQSYQLNDTVNNKVLGRGGKDYFNKVTYVGIHTSHGIILTQDALTPWEKDKDYEAYRNKYKPVVFRSAICHTGRDTTMKTLNDTIAANSVTKIEGSTLIMFTNSTLKDGLECDSTIGLKEGWLVWIVKDEEEEGKDGELNFISYKKEMNVGTGKALNILDLPHTDKSLIGGIFVEPQPTAIGQITFKLSGIATETNEGWKMIFPFVKKQQKEEIKEELTILNAPNPDKGDKDKDIKTKKRKRK